MTVAIGLWLGIKTEQALSNDTSVGVPYVQRYPAMVDAEPTLNEHARQTVLKEFADKRRVVAQAELKRQQALLKRKSTVKTVVSRSTKAESPTVTYEATAYVALCDTGCSGITATGVDVRNTIHYVGHRVIAVDPALIPLGSLVRVSFADGKTFTALAIDTGGHIDGYRIDILVGSEREAWAFGRQNVGIKIIRNGAD